MLATFGSSDLAGAISAIETGCGSASASGTIASTLVGSIAGVGVGVGVGGRERSGVHATAASLDVRERPEGPKERPRAAGATSGAIDGGWAGEWAGWWAGVAGALGRLLGRLADGVATLNTFHLERQSGRGEGEGEGGCFAGSQLAHTFSGPPRYPCASR